jgi:hypothetical protein
MSPTKLFPRLDLLALAVALVATCAAGACQSSTPQGQRCSNIPAGGCPLEGDNEVCIDPSCTAVYACNPDQTWSLDHPCSPHDAGVVDAARPDTGPTLRDASIDAVGANGGPGCQDLEPPDCPLALGVACPNGSCCGCEDLYVCQNGGWMAWGTCADGGLVMHPVK